jgi:DNA-binding CsgD family transcriptional regulator
MLTASEIATQLYVSVNTIKAHVKSIYLKLGVPAAGRRRPGIRRWHPLARPFVPPGGRRGEILAHVERGASNAEITTRLYLSEKTVHHHESAILCKLAMSPRWPRQGVAYQRVRRLAIAVSVMSLPAARLPFRRMERLAGADPLVDHLIQPVLLPDAVRGAQQHRRDRHQPDRPAHRRVDPLLAPQTDA